MYHVIAQITFAVFIRVLKCQILNFIFKQLHNNARKLQYSQVSYPIHIYLLFVIKRYNNNTIIPTSRIHRSIYLRQQYDVSFSRVYCFIIIIRIYGNNST